MPLSDIDFFGYRRVERQFKSRDLCDEPKTKKNQMIYPKKTEIRFILGFHPVTLRDEYSHRFVESHIVTAFYLCRRFVHGFFTEPVKQFDNTSGLTCMELKPLS